MPAGLRKRAPRCCVRLSLLVCVLLHSTRACPATHTQTHMLTSEISTTIVLASPNWTVATYTTSNSSSSSTNRTWLPLGPPSSGVWFLLSPCFRNTGRLCSSPKTGDSKGACPWAKPSYGYLKTAVHSLHSGVSSWSGLFQPVIVLVKYMHDCFPAALKTQGVWMRCPRPLGKSGSKTLTCEGNGDRLCWPLNSPTHHPHPAFTGRNGSAAVTTGRGATTVAVWQAGHMCRAAPPRCGWEGTRRPLRT